MNITINISDVTYEPDIENLERIARSLRDTLEKQKKEEQNRMEQFRGLQQAGLGKI